MAVLAAAGVEVAEPAGVPELDPKAALAALAAGEVDAVMLVGAAPFRRWSRPSAAPGCGCCRWSRRWPRTGEAGLVALPIPAGAYAGQSEAVPAWRSPRCW